MSRGKNPRLKKAHAETEYTNEQIMELVKCMDDPVYFIMNYVYIKHPLKGQILFSMYDYQQELVDLYEENRFSIVLSARQTGKTETTCAYLLWHAIFKDNQTVLIVSNKSSNAMEMIAKIQNAYEELPNWLKPGIDDASWNKHECKFDNKSRIISQATSSDSGRGLSISLLYCDELAFVKPHIQSQFWDSIYPTLSTGGACIISSTPNGSTNLFAELWRKWENGIGEFKGMYVPWDAPPGRDEKFKKDNIAILGEDKWKQEYECKFLSSDGTLIDSELLEKHEKHILTVEPAFKIEDQVFWKKIHPEKTYVISCDPATGSKKDFSVIQAFEFPSMEQVMEYRNNTMNSVFIYSYLKKVVNFFHRNGGEVYWSFENNSVGQAIAALYETDENPPDASLISEPSKNKLGFHTSLTSKVKACLKFKEMFEDGKIRINSKAFIKELHSYVRKSNSYEAQVGATDDCVSAFLITLRILEEMATYDSAAYFKLYGLEDEEEWNPDESNIDQNPLPFVY